jgi:hypothetical protein
VCIVQKKKKLLGRGYTQDIPLGRPTGPREKKKETVKGKERIETE